MHCVEADFGDCDFNVSSCTMNVMYGFAIMTVGFELGNG